MLLKMHIKTYLDKKQRSNFGLSFNSVRFFRSGIKLDVLIKNVRTELNFPTLCVRLIHIYLCFILDHWRVLESSHMKKRFKAMHGTNAKHVPKYLFEFHWRWALDTFPSSLGKCSNKFLLEIQVPYRSHEY